MQETWTTRFTQEGLHFLGTTTLDLEQDFARFQQWLSESKQAGMQFLEKYDEIRRDPKKLLPEATGALIVGLPYDQGDSWPFEQGEAPRIAQYARFKDYHKLFREKVEKVCSQYASENPDFRFRVCVDTAPLLERALAAKAGLGFVGKNTCYIHESHGSFLLLAVVLCNWEVLEKSEAKEAACGSCSLCQVACPTGALNEDYTIDSRKCLSYWSIEHRGEIPLEFWPHFEKYYFGCDICQLACPYNHEARENGLPTKIEKRGFPDRVTTALMSETEYQKYFGGTPLTRAKQSGLQRNALISLTVTRHPDLKRVLEELGRHPDPVLRKTVESAKRYPELFRV